MSNNNRPTYIAGGIAALVGTGMLVGTFFMARSTIHFVSVSVEAKGVVLENILRTSEGENGTSYTYAPKIKFFTKDNTEVIFVSGTSQSPAAYGVGDTVNILYDPSRPNNAKVDGFFDVWGSLLILSILALAFSGVGYGVILYHIRRKIIKKRLIARGYSVVAKVVSADRDMSYSVNKKHPYRIDADWLDTKNNTLYHFKSDHMWFDITPYVKPGMDVSVWIDPDKPKVHAMDTSFLPKEVG